MSSRARTGMPRFDRYVRCGRRWRDLATGRMVRCRWRAGGDGPPLFTTHRGATLIDAEPREGGRFEIWEPGGDPVVDTAEAERALAETLAMAQGAGPRVVACPPAGRLRRAALVRRLAWTARVHGWVPIAAARLAGEWRAGRGAWTAERSLVVFAAGAGARTALAWLARQRVLEAKPQVVVTWTKPGAAAAWRRLAWPRVAAEAPGVYQRAVEDRPTTMDEARARWAAVAARARTAAWERAAVDLARIVAGRGRPFEARGLLAAVERGADAALLAALDASSRARAAAALAAAAVDSGGEQAGRDDMVDDFVGVLRLCQDVEDEQVALARVGAYVRERLQAASVAFVVRGDAGLRAVAAAGLAQDVRAAAATAMESGCVVPAAAAIGAAESAAPVRYAGDVIGALWARWGTGTPVSGADAAALLGVAAVAAAPSLRGVLDRERLAAEAGVPELVGESAGIRLVREAVVRAARSPFPVLIEGESGVGKELVARAIHAGSSRRGRAFSAINCAALVDDLVEAELFGHVRGAFTGAQTDRPGLFEEASGGTLFLDEVAELGSRVQAKLLRTLQEGEVRRLGEAHTRRVDVRIVAATNRPLGGEVLTGRFRRDLWYRLDVIRIAVPPVRERLEDLPLLVRQAWTGLAARTGSRAVLSASAVAALAAYDWPGNVRELQNVLASILVSAPRRGVLGPAHLPAHVARAAALAPAGTLEAARRQFETRFVRAALARANGRTTAAARELGLSRQGLAKVLVRLGLAGGKRAAPAHVE